MNLDFSEEQLILRTAARDFLEAECPAKLLREIMEGEELYAPQLWGKVAGLGWLSLIFPEEYGGADGTFFDFVALLEETGRALLPLPLLQTVIAGLAVLKAGNERLKSTILPDIVSGRIKATMAIAEEGGDYHHDTVTTRAVTSNNGYIITGSKSFIQYAPIMDKIIVAARTSGDSGENGITLFVVDGKDSRIDCKQLKSTTGAKYYHVILDGVTVPSDMVLGEVDKGWPIVSQMLLFDAAARCAVALGSATRVLEMTVDIAKTRIQFGRPIGTFQAVQQLCAEILIDVDSIKYLTYQAAGMLAQDIPCAREVAIARVGTDAAYKRLVALAVKTHGGVGFTRDHDVGLHFLNAVDDELPFSHADYYRRTIAREFIITGV
ncbi:acyl-CoA dehydrogenase family protein [Chloroflexota bacterium]